MSKATTYLNIIPLRAEASHRSEMISQILFAEELEILEEEGDFTKIRMKATQYEGWVQSNQIVLRSACTPSSTSIVGLAPVQYVQEDYSNKLYHGSPIDSSMNTHMHIEGVLRKPTIVDFNEEFPKLIHYYLHVPYLWGGRSICGIDCSGLSQIIYAHFGLALKRDAYQQAEEGKIVDFLQEIKPADLAFFDNDHGKITHVGIMVDSETIFHASGEVRLDKLDQEGIFNTKLNKYTHKLRIVKRYF